MFRDLKGDHRDTIVTGGLHDLRAVAHCISCVSTLTLLVLLGTAGPSFSQSAASDQLLRPGEAYVTRFSGTVMQPGANGQPSPVIDTAGTVGSIIDIRSPNRPPRGEHWYDEPQRRPVSAGEVGQVFGVVLDDATPPNIYLSATAAFGLHLAPGTKEWMPGMWGRGGGPGTIYRLSRDNNYQPTVFANVAWGERSNTGAALGNMAFDRVNKQLFVSDLETGMIHRIRASDGADLGFYDHGVIGRANFFDAENNVPGSLPAIMFDPRSRARIDNCAAGPFERFPECWNFAASGRRVWGLGVHRDLARNETRLYYAVWSSPALGNAAQWNAAGDDDKRNSVWSVRLGAGGYFDITSIRREFLLPDFFVEASDIARSGFSQPVSDISFSECSDRPVMLIAERGGIRNLGLAADNPFAYPHEARALRYELDTTGVWRPVGRYDVGYYDRKNEGQPYLRANCAGGIAFAPGYGPNWTMDLAKTDQFVWITGDYLCSPEGPCHLFGSPPESAQAGEAAQPAAAAIAQDGDDSQVHGAQGLAEGSFDEVMPAGALGPYPAGEGPPYPATGPDQSYLIDTDINIDAAGNLIETELSRNDATKIGDIAIYEMCVPRRQLAYLPPPPPLGTAPPVLVGHDPDRSHFLIASHEVRMSHYRFGSHNPYWSHNRFHSHNPEWSHSRRGSHNSRWSHSRRGSHNTAASHHTPPRGHHLVAISSHRRTPPTTTSQGGGGGGPATSGGGTGGGGRMSGGTCSTVNGKTTCTSTPPTQPSQQVTVTGGGTCSTVNGKTNCTTTPTEYCVGGHCSTTPPPGFPTMVHSSSNSAFSPASPSHTGQNSGTSTMQTHHAAISRQGSSHTSNQSHTTSHTTSKTTRTSHTSRTTHTSRTVSHSSRGSRSASFSRGSHGGGGYHSSGRGFGGRGGGGRSFGGFGGGGRSFGGSRGRHSDIRLKQDIRLLQRLDNGIGLYRFRYKGDERTIYVGVLAQEVREIVPGAVTRGRDGYLRVRYDRIGVDFMTWDAWLAAHRDRAGTEVIGLEAKGVRIGNTAGERRN
jgi:endosialidase-like protein